MLQILIWALAIVTVVLTALPMFMVACAPQVEGESLKRVRGWARLFLVVGILGAIWMVLTANTQASSFRLSSTSNHSDDAEIAALRAETDQIMAESERLARGYYGR
jgi:NADH:ubiquinone oxidoreductase subunit 6 (subunit J)